MAGFIAEFFGYRAEDTSSNALKAVVDKKCPFLSAACVKRLGREHVLSGVCAIRLKKPGSPSVICCPNRIYADNYKMLRTIAFEAFGVNLNLYAGRAAVAKARCEHGAIAVFGHGWGGELRLPKRKGVGSYFVDWVLARLDENGDLVEFTAIEVQTIDTTNSYSQAREHLAKDRSVIADTVGLNWENVAKRIISQIIYKGQILQRESLCKTGIYFVCPKPVYEYVLNRLGGKEALPKFPTQPAAIHFVAYDYLTGFGGVKPGQIVPLGVVEGHCTTVYKVQEAFSSLNLPEGDVYGNAIRKCLYGT